MRTINHIPIMQNEVVDYLINDLNGTYVDCTIGFGGHSYEILEKLNNKGFLIGIDLDPYALNKTKEKLSGLNKQFSLHNFAYKDFPVLASITIADFPTMRGTGASGRMTLNALAALRLAAKIDLPGDLFDCALAIGTMERVRIIAVPIHFLHLFTFEMNFYWYNFWTR